MIEYIILGSGVVVLIIGLRSMSNPVTHDESKYNNAPTDSVADVKGRGTRRPDKVGDLTETNNKKAEREAKLAQEYKKAHDKGRYKYASQLARAFRFGADADTSLMTSDA